MYENEESIYNLIPPEQVDWKATKGKRYKSKFDPKIPPTASTFGNHTTNRLVGNFNGDYQPQGGKHTGKSQAKWGKKPGAEKPDPKGFTKKMTGTMRLPDKPEKFKREVPKKPAIPKKEDKPIHGLVSDKNFIVANAVENILAAPKIPENKDKDMLKKKTYGKVPKYLKKIKNEIEDEYQLVQDLHQEEEA